MLRRDAIKKGAQIFAMTFIGVGVFTEVSKSKPVLLLRPPGALDEKDFITHCIKCGLCVEVCPFDTLKLATFKDGMVKLGTPFFVPRTTPCEMCIDIPCTVACPTGALDVELVSQNDKLDITKSKMGVAVVDDKNCVAYFGVQCDACYRACPLIDKAIFIDYKKNERTQKHAKLLPVVDSDYCTGCGKCEKACITDKASITVLPRDVVIGKINDNYVRGWIKDDDDKLKNSNTNIKLDSKKGLDYLNGGDEL